MDANWTSLKDRRPLRLGLVLVPHFSLMAFSSLIEPARNANLQTGTELYSWRIFSETQSQVRASLGLALASEPLDALDVQEFDLIFLVSGLVMDMDEAGTLRRVLREAHRHGTRIGAVSTASFFLAQAGMLNGRACTVHLDYQDALMERYPQLEVRNDLFVMDGPFVTCGGGIAGMDLMLHLITLQHGEALARRIAQQFMHERVRSPADPQSMELGHRYGVRHPQLLEALRLMEASMQDPMAKAEIAQLAGMSPRQLERLFRGHLGASPARFYLRMRLEKAQRLLRQTGMSVTEVAVACGFESASHFSKRYREYLGTRPSNDRKAELARLEELNQEK